MDEWDQTQNKRSIIKANLFPHGLFEIGWNFLCNLCYTHYVETWASLWEIREWSQMAIFHDAYIDLGEEMSWQKRMTFPFNWKVGLRNQTTTGRLVLMPSGDHIQLLYLYTTTHFHSRTHHNFISLYNCTFPFY